MAKIARSVIGVLVLALFGCSRGGKDQEQGKHAAEACKSDKDCAKGYLCESKACVPKAVAEKVRAAERAKKEEKPKVEPSPAPAPAGSSAAPANEGPIPLIPTTKSNPPQGTEWEQGVAVNTQEVNSQPDDCTLRVMREWVQVTCTGPYTGYEKMKEFGRKGMDYYEAIRPGKSVSFVVRLHKGKSQSVHICAPEKGAQLFMSWPKDKDRPSHIALGRGPVCEEEGKDEDKDKGKGKGKGK